MAILRELFGARIDLGDGEHLDALLAPGRTESESADELSFRLLLENFTGTDRLGRKWVNGKEVKSEGSANARTDVATVPPEHLEAIKQGVLADVPASIKRNSPGFFKKLTVAAAGVAETAWHKVVHWTPAACRVASAVLGEVLDTPSDLKKFGYNPTTSSGLAGHADNDFIKLHAGVSGHLAISIASHVLSRALLYAKSKVNGAKSESEIDGLREVAEVIADVFAATNAALGLEGAPDADQVAKVLKELLGGTSNAV